MPPSRLLNRAVALSPLLNMTDAGEHETPADTRDLLRFLPTILQEQIHNANKKIAELCAHRCY